MTNDNKHNLKPKNDNTPSEPAPPSGPPPRWIYNDTKIKPVIEGNKEK